LLTYLFLPGTAPVRRNVNATNASDALQPGDILNDIALTPAKSTRRNIAQTPVAPTPADRILAFADEDRLARSPWTFAGASESDLTAFAKRLLTPAEDPADKDYSDGVASGISEGDSDAGSEFDIGDLPSPSPALQPALAGLSGAQVSRRDAPRSSQRTPRSTAYFNNGMGLLAGGDLADGLSTLDVAGSSTGGIKRPADEVSPSPTARKRRALPSAFAKAEESDASDS
jgi:hypothetical protein